MSPSPRLSLFHPVIVLLASFGAAALFAGLITYFTEGDTQWYLLYYFVPIGVPFVAFCFDRLEQRAAVTPIRAAIDLLVVVTSLLRTVSLIPFVSGHALFLTYALGTTRSTVARVTALLVLLEVAYLKIVAWRDTTLFGGVAVACLAILAYRSLGITSPDDWQFDAPPMTNRPRCRGGKSSSSDDNHC